MSMIMNFWARTDQQLTELLEDPSLVHDACEEALEADAEDFIDVDKARHCIHFLLTGTADAGAFPLSFVAAGGREVGDEDVGYGPARALMSADVAKIAAALAPIDRMKLVEKFDARRMDQLEIYPFEGSWADVDPQSDDPFGSFLENFDSLKKLVQRAAATKRGMLVWMD